MKTGRFPSCEAVLTHSNTTATTSGPLVYPARTKTSKKFTLPSSLFTGGLCFVLWRGHPRFMCASTRERERYERGEKVRRKSKRAQCYMVCINMQLSLLASSPVLLYKHPSQTRCGKGEENYSISPGADPVSSLPSSVVPSLPLVATFEYFLSLLQQDSRSRRNI